MRAKNLAQKQTPSLFDVDKVDWGGILPNAMVQTLIYTNEG